MESKLYKITNTSNGMVYYGIIYKKNKTIYERFEEHMTGKGGKFLYDEGVLKYGRVSFSIELLETGPLDYIRDREVELNKTNLWPVGYNGNTSHAIIVSQEGHKEITRKKKEAWDIDPTKKPVPPNWKGKTRSDKMRSKLSKSKTGHIVTDETRSKISKSLEGKIHSAETIDKRNKSIEKNPNAYNRKNWLLVSPSGEMHYTKGKIHQKSKELGLSYSKTFKINLNTGVAITTINPSPLRGWTVYNDNDKIDILLKNHES